MTQSGKRLRALIESDAVTVVPGCGDVVSARLIEEAGFAAAYMSGFWTSATRGFLDVGLIGLSEMAQNATYITRAIDVPLICDADTGFSDGPLQIRRCVQEFEAAGAAGISLEDQTLLKRCGLREDKRLVSLDVMRSKIEVAVASRSAPDFVIVARTDAIESEGVERTVARGRAYLDAGADLIFVEGFRTEEEVEAVGRALPQRQLVYNQAPAGYGPQVALSDLDRLGVALVLFPAHLALAAMRAQQELLSDLASTGSIALSTQKLASIDELSRLLGESEATHFESQFGPLGDARDQRANPQEEKEKPDEPVLSPDGY